MLHEQYTGFHPFNVFSYDAVWAETWTHHLPTVGRMHYQLRHAITLQTVIHIWLGSSEYILSSMVEISSTLSNFPLKYKKELYGMLPFKISENNHFRQFNLKNGIKYKSIEQRKGPIQHLIINITNPSSETYFLSSFTQHD